MQSLTVEKIYKHLIPYHMSGQTLLASHKNQLVTFQPFVGGTRSPIGNIPWGIAQLPCHIRLVDRLLKHSILFAHQATPEKYLVANDHGWWLLEAGKEAISVDMPSKSRPTLRSMCNGLSGSAYYAEYFSNRARGPVSVLKNTDTSFTKFLPVYTFPAGMIRHVHALLNDPHIPERIWILCGDEDHECFIFYTDNEFETVEEFCNFGQQSRAVDMRITKNKLLWAMDSPLETSFILEVDKHSPKQPEKTYELPGPAYYMSENQAGGVYIGTTAEPGPGAKDNKAHIIAQRPDGSWKDIYASETDLVPQFGIFYMPQGVLPENYLMFFSRAVKQREGKLIVARDNAWQAIPSPTGANQ